MLCNETVTFKTGCDFTLEQLVTLYDSVGWFNYSREPGLSHLQEAVNNSSYVVSAWYQNQLIGLARGLSDDVSIFYLQDILVHPDFQNRGIGKQLMLSCLQRYKHVRTKVLLTDDEERQLHFYESLGYKNTQRLKSHVLNTYIQIEGVT